MEQTVHAFDQQYLEKTTTDLLVLKAEIQKLKNSIRAAEASKRSRLMSAGGKPAGEFISAPPGSVQHGPHAGDRFG
jgi:hypothetical protein